MILLVTGGARSGKSSYAQQKALSLSDNPVYVATAQIWDREFAKRVQRHKEERKAPWTSYEVEQWVSQAPIQGKVAVIDCVTLWLTNFFVRYKNDVEQSLASFKGEIDRLSEMEGTFILVTNEIGMGIHADAEVGRRFTDLQGWANQYIAAGAKEVILMISGIPVTIK